MKTTAPETITFSCPHRLLARLNRVVRITGRPLDRVIVAILSTSRFAHAADVAFAIELDTEELG
jgi:hypothetical protein